MALPALTLLVAGCFLASSATTFAGDDRMDRLSQAHKDWLEKEVVYIISEKERDGFLNLQSEEEREAFVKAFWHARDPDKLTPENEFRIEHYERIEFANNRLGGESSVPGWMTDRGRMHITLGPPAEREVFDSVNSMYPTELWFYNQERGKSLPPLYLLFFQQYGAGPYLLFNHALHEPVDLMPGNSLVLDSRQSTYGLLQEINPALAHATINMRADQGVYANFAEPMRNALDTTQLLADIQISPFRRLDTRYVDAAGNRGIVEADYMFNYVPSTGLANVLPGPEGTMFVHYTLELEPQHMTMAKDKDRYYTSFEIRGEVTDPDGRLVYDFMQEPYVRLTESQFQEVGARAFAYRSMFPLRDGDYNLRIILKNRARSEYTIFEQGLEVPSTKSRAAALAAPVLLYGYAVLEDTPETAAAYRTYRFGRYTFEPNAKEVFITGSRLLAYVAHRNAPSGSTIQAFVRSQPPAGSETTADTLAEPVAEGSLDPRIEPSVLILPLDGVESGRYRLDITIRDESGKTLAENHVSFDVSPRSRLDKPWAVRDSIDGENVGLVKVALAQQYLRLDEPERARVLAAQSLERDPNILPARLLLGRFALDDGDYPRAIELLEPARAQAPDDADILQTLGDAHFHVQNYPRARELYELALNIRGPNVPILNALAVSTAQTGDVAKAIALLDQSLGLDEAQDSVRALKADLEAGSPPRGR